VSYTPSLSRAYFALARLSCY